MRNTLIYFVLLFAAATLFAAGANEEGLEIGYPMSISSIPLMELIERYPEDYNGSGYTDHPQALGQLINGELDVLASGFTVGLSRFASTGDIGHLDSFVWGVSAIMTAEDMSDISELEGKSLYIPFAGSPIDIQIKAHLAAAGLEGMVEISYAPFPQAAGLLVQDKADAAVLVEPLASKLETEGNAFRLMNIQDSYAAISGGEPRSPQVSLFSRGDFYGENTRSINRLLRRMESVGEEIADDPAAFAAKYSEVFSLPEEVILGALENTLFEYLPASRDRDLIGAYTGLMGLPVPGDEFYLD